MGVLRGRTTELGLGAQKIMKVRTRARPRHLVQLLIGVAVVSCGGREGARQWAGIVLDSAGVRVVHNPVESFWIPEEEWTFTESLRIGEDVGDPTLEFGKIVGIQVDSRGMIYVLDQMASEIRVFDQEGSHVRTFGSRGEGPGEFSSGAAGLFLMESGHLVVPDLGNQRMNRISLDGEFLGSARVSYSSGFPVRWDSDGGGSVTVQRRAMGFNEDPVLAAGDPLVRIGPDGGEETLVVLPKAKTVWMEGAAARFKYFETEPSWDLGPSGDLRTAMTQEYRIDVRGPDGSIHTSFTKPSPPRPVTDQDLDRFDELMRDALERRELSPSAIQRQLDNFAYGATFPAFNRIMEGPDGTTLVQQIADLRALETLDLSEEMSRRLGSRTWDVFDAEERFLGEIVLPPRFTPFVWQTSTVYGRWLDGLDRHYVLRLDLVR